MQQDSEGLNLERALGVLRRRVFVLALCVVVVGGAAYGFSKHEVKEYTATASLVFSSNSLGQQIAGLSGGGTGSSSSALLAAEANNIELVKGGGTAAKTASVLGRGLTPQKVSESVSVAGQGESGVVDVSVTMRSPRLAAQIANTYSAQFVEGQQIANRQYFKSALALVHKQLRALSPQQRIGTDGVALQNRAQTLGLLAELNNSNVQVGREALVPAGPSSPKTSRNTALGLVLGLLIGLALVFLLERLDRRIRTAEDLAAIYRLPLLGSVPESAALARPARDKSGKRAVLPPAEAEAFSLIRAHLRFFNIDRDLRTILIASAAPGDGKTTVARHLAEAAARQGSRVLLLEVDLRHPTVARQLEIQPGSGLAEVLIGVTPMDQATQSIPLEASPGEGAEGRMLHVLAAGTVLPPNPAELLESRAMDVVLDRARYAYDLVVIDTPPLTAVSDAFPLLPKVDGVVVVGWVGQSRRDAGALLHQVLAGTGAPLLGVIANGSKSGTPTANAYFTGIKPSIGAVSVNGAASSEELAPTSRA